MTTKLHGFTDAEHMGAWLNGLIRAMRTEHRILQATAKTFVVGRGEMEPILTPGDHADEQTICYALADAVVLGLGQVVETLRALSECRPTEVDPVLKVFAGDLDRWTAMRDDAAHRFDRMHRGQRAGSNDAFIDGCQGYHAARYDLALDSIGTGKGAFNRSVTDARRMILADAIERADECVKAACQAIGYDHEAKLASFRTRP